jgi:hypothetical protein
MAALAPADEVKRLSWAAGSVKRERKRSMSVNRSSVLALFRSIVPSEGVSDKTIERKPSERDRPLGAEALGPREEVRRALIGDGELRLNVVAPGLHLVHVRSQLLQFLYSRHQFKGQCLRDKDGRSACRLERRRSSFDSSRESLPSQLAGSNRHPSAFMASWTSAK